MNRKREQIQEQQESVKGFLCRRSQAESVIRLERKVFVSSIIAVCEAPSHVCFVKTPELKRLCFYKESSGCFLFFPASGIRSRGDGSIADLGKRGLLWSATSSSGGAALVSVGSGGCSVYSDDRRYGLSVRCVQASATVWAVQKENIKQIRFRRESGKDSLYRRGQADSVTRLGRKLSVGHSLLPCAAPSYSISLIELPVLNSLYFYKHFSGYFFFFPASGNRSYNAGSLINSGRSGYGWTATPVGSNAWYLDVWSGSAHMLDNVSRGFGFPVRCVQASAPVFVLVKETFVFFPAAGYRHFNNGSLSSAGTEGFGWTSLSNGVNAFFLRILSGVAHVREAPRTYGFPVRCVQASAAVFVFIKETFVFFPASGFRNGTDGTLREPGVSGYGWTSTLYVSGRAYTFLGYGGTATVGHDGCTYGFPVRCVQASATVFAFSNCLKWRKMAV